MNPSGVLKLLISVLCLSLSDAGWTGGPSLLGKEGSRDVTSHQERRVGPGTGVFPTSDRTVGIGFRGRTTGLSGTLVFPGPGRSEVDR